MRDLSNGTYTIMDLKLYNEVIKKVATEGYLYGFLRSLNSHIQ